MVPDRKFLRESPGTEAAPPPSEWAPFGGASDFGKNMGIAFAALFIAFALAFATGALIRRRFLCFRRRNPAAEKPEVAKATAMIPEAIPSIVFSARDGLPRRAGASTSATAECAICLLEFADGDSVRLLPNCGHGFHAGCIDLWIASRRSCPTCRKSCLPPTERLETGEV